MPSIEPAPAIVPENGQNGGAPPAPSAAAAPPAEPSTSALIIGQSTAVIAAAAAVVYGSGALSMGLRLWYDHYSWSPVLGQLPRNLILVDAISYVMAPAILIGVLAYILYRQFDRQLGSAMKWLVAVGFAAAIAFVPLIFLEIVRRNTIHGVIRPYWEIYLLCAILNLAFVRVALHLLPRANIRGLREVLGIGILALAFTPAVASVSAAYAFPIVKVCGPAFSHDGGDYAIGNLVGSDGQWIYVAETIANMPRTGTYRFIGGYIAVIPLSSVRLEAIGGFASCGDLHAAATPAK